MPRVLITPTAVTRAGVAPAAEANGDPTNGQYTPNDGKTYILVRNSNGASVARTMTIQFGYTIDGQAITARPYVIPAAGIRYVGPFDVTTYGTRLNIDSDNAELKYVILQFP